MLDRNDINRFLKIHNGATRIYETVLRELILGIKPSHPTYTVLPSLRAISEDVYERYLYGISGRQEAIAYLNHEVLGNHLREMTAVLLHHKDRPLTSILHPNDILQLQSCMTLFDCVQPNMLFMEVLNTFFGGRRCQTTDTAYGQYKQLNSLPPDDTKRAPC